LTISVVYLTHLYNNVTAAKILSSFNKYRNDYQLEDQLSKGIIVPSLTIDFDVTHHNPQSQCLLFVTPQ